jgi:superfamily II DNA or RNA helicase
MQGVLSWADCAKRFGIAWKDGQQDAYDQWQALERKRMLLFFPTGEGKSKTALALLRSQGHTTAVIIAPPKTHKQWQADARTLGMDVVLHSVQKFRMKDTKYSRNIDAWLVDEFHQMGGHGGAGFMKFARMMRGFTGSVMLLSATPNYNDAERVFCALAIGDEMPSMNYGDWLMANCRVQASRFSHYPDVLGFLNFDSAIDFLRSRPWVAYIEDKAKWTPVDLIIPRYKGQDMLDFLRLGYYRRVHKITASDMEDRHKLVDLSYIADDGRIRKGIYDQVVALLQTYPERGRWFIFCQHATVARALHRTLPGSWIIDGDSSKKQIDHAVESFSAADMGLLIGTTAIATGVDGIDKVCQSMLILDDIEGDPSMRRQLIGRILPRGLQDDRERIVVTASFGL